ncbi:MAG: hypothetical protein COA78_12905 [Blastopirellula sp.]|nr:MAG: hypothetical protein COA78_12905 [Blastopirellula sp.]
MSSDSKSQREQLIRDDVTYTKREFMKACNIGEAAFLSLCRQGMPVCRIASRTFVSGSKANAFFSQLSDAQSSDASLAS